MIKKMLIFILVCFCYFNAKAPALDDLIAAAKETAHEGAKMVKQIQTKKDSTTKPESTEVVINPYPDDVWVNKVYIKIANDTKYTLVEEPVESAAKKALKIAYANPKARMARRLMPRQLTGLFSDVYGKIKSNKNPEKTKQQIDNFLVQYGYIWDSTTKKYIPHNEEQVKIAKAFAVDPAEWVVPDGGFESFNDFFTKALKQEARPIGIGETTIVAPADSKLMVIENIGENTTFFRVKHKKFTLKKFLKHEDLANAYTGGTLVIFRLSPYNYHRFHFPIDCQPQIPKVISGGFDSVDPIAYKTSVMPLTENLRHLITLKTKQFGDIIMVAVGAFNVGSIIETFTKEVKTKHFGITTGTDILLKDRDKTYHKGDEAGYFQYGGSTITLLFKKNSIKINPQFLKHSREGYETAVKMGEPFATFIIQ